MSSSSTNRIRIEPLCTPAQPDSNLTNLAASGSAFKRGLSQLQVGDQIVASQLAGSFTLPRNKRRKLAFIAGGIGITPFRSMLEDLLDRGEARPITVLYGNNRIDEVAYADVLKRAREELDVRTWYAVRDAAGATPEMAVGVVDAAMIVERIPDYRQRTFYISGPQAMVSSTRQTLREIGVPARRIKTDFFPGLA